MSQVSRPSIIFRESSLGNMPLVLTTHPRDLCLPRASRILCSSTSAINQNTLPSGLTTSSSAQNRDRGRGGPGISGPLISRWASGEKSCQVILKLHLIINTRRKIGGKTAVAESEGRGNSRRPVSGQTLGRCIKRDLAVRWGSSAREGKGVRLVFPPTQQRICILLCALPH